MDLSKTVQRSFDDMEYAHEFFTENYWDVFFLPDTVLDDPRFQIGVYAECLWLKNISDDEKFMCKIRAYDKYNMAFIRNHMEEALANGVEGWLEALYAGVPYEDIVA